ncbi:hypothetical protein BRD00_13065 [Halobacteriales archaeon QS_8_69_26]|nr:MAG: hypothetical protein BRD00_13065 [Halobacteriales archaeon QS_8_69_26]
MSSAPGLPPAFADRGWKEVSRDSKDELDLPFFSIRSHNAVYRHESVAHLSELIAVGVDAGPRSVFTTALEFSPPLSDFGVDPASVFGVARRHARREFARSIREDGLSDVTRTDARWTDRDDGGRARAFRYEVGFPLVPSAVLSDPGGVGSLTLRGVLWAGIWPTDDAYAMAGGIYPDETIADAVDRQAPGAGAGTDPYVELDRATHRREVAAVIQSAGID